jgi:hypothetical protein
MEHISTKIISSAQDVLKRLQKFTKCQNEKNNINNVQASK